MLSLEAEIKRFFHQSCITLEDNSASPTKPDFTMFGVVVDAKEKLQAFQPKNWPGSEKFDSRRVFIFDELTIRKALLTGKPSGFIIRTEDRYYWVDTWTLILLPRIRYDRQMQVEFKGKWLTSLDYFEEYETLEEVIKAVYRYGRDFEQEMTRKECTPVRGAPVQRGGIARTDYHRRTDYNATR